MRSNEKLESQERQDGRGLPKAGAGMSVERLDALSKAFRGEKKAKQRPMRRQESSDLPNPPDSKGGKLPAFP